MFAFCGDLHLGVKLPTKDFFKSLDAFLGFIKSQKEECECIFVVGDLFDHRLNIDECRIAATFLLNLCINGCGKDGTNVPVHIVHGTYSHDYEQYGIFIDILKKIPGVELFYTNKTHVGHVGKYKVLYLPQIYEQFDDSVFNDSYDLIVGHGPISSVTKNPCKAANYEIVHSADKLGEISKLCVFGHYHAYTDFGNNVYYCGPWLTWRYDENTEKVFFLSDSNFNVIKKQNQFAMKFDTVVINSTEQLRNELAKDISNPHRFIIEPSRDNVEEFNAIISVTKNENIKFVMQKLEDVVEDKPIYVETNTHVEPVPALIEYIKEKYDVDAREVIDDYVSKIQKEE